MQGIIPVILYLLKVSCVESDTNNFMSYCYIPGYPCSNIFCNIFPK